MKARGVASMPGLHTLRITTNGVQVFPRITARSNSVRPTSATRLSTGIIGLDEMMGGGIPAGDSLVLAGPTGTGKTTFAMKFVRPASSRRVGGDSDLREPPVTYTAPRASTWTRARSG